MGSASLDHVCRKAEAVVPKSAAHCRRASGVIPGGTTRSRFFWPSPVFIDRGEGPYLYDVDGRQYVDCTVGFGSMILGHCHPRVQDAVRKQLSRGSMFGYPVLAEEAMAHQIIQHVPGAERVAFLNSGTEATWAAARIARAITGRSKIAKFEGEWHGWHDFGVTSYFTARGDVDAPESVADSLGIPKEVTSGVVVLPYNDQRSLERVALEANELACVFVEAVQGGAGAIPIDRELLHGLREVTRRHGVLLVMDEVITGFRVSKSGASGYYGVRGDLVTLGKVIGGGTPLGAVAGRADVMDQIAQQRENDQIVMFGTFSANPLSLAAGAAQLDVLLSDNAHYDHLNDLGEAVRDGIRRAFREAKVEAHVTGIGSMWGYHFVSREPRSRRDQRGRNVAAAKALGAYLRVEGVIVASPAQLAFISTAHKREDIEFVVAAHRKALQQMKDDGIVTE